MNYKIFGFEIRKAGTEPALTVPDNRDGSINNEVTSSGAAAYGYYFDLNKKLTNEIELINKYRSMAQVAEIDIAVTSIVDEAVVIEEEQPPVSINIRSDNGDVPENIQEVIANEFQNILTKLKFHQEGHEIFRQWYIDGRYYAQIVVDEENLVNGISEIRALDPRKIKKVRDIVKQRNSGGVDVVVDIKDYYVYNDSGINSASNGIRLSPDSVICATSGLVDEYGNSISFLHKAIKPSNMLRYMEDAALIYTLSRAPARRVFYIDVADMPKQKADQYMMQTMTKYKNKIVYDTSTGEVRDDRVNMSMLEDYWLPRRSNGRATEITTLPSENITGQMENITYFLNKLYNSLSIPISRLRPDNAFSLGRTEQITRDEVSFSKFIDRQRNRFSQLFLQALRVQLILKGIIAPEDWEFIRSRITFDYLRDNYFAELKEAEILSNRINMMNQIQPLVGMYYSPQWVRKNVLHQSDEEIEKIDEEIAIAMKTTPQFFPQLMEPK